MSGTEKRRLFLIKFRDQQMQKLESVTASAKFDEGDVRAVTAGIEFIVRSGAKNNTNAEVLSDELQQLGLPRGTKPRPILVR